MTLQDNAHRLTREHLAESRGGELGWVPALLDQLAHAVTEQTRAGSAGGGGRSLPIGEGALALFQDIDREARAEHHKLEPWAIGTLTEIIQAWPAMEVDATTAAHLQQLTKGWCEQIEDIVAPSKPPRRIHLPCPSCGVLYGGEERRPVLHLHCWAPDESILPPGEWTAECVDCGAAWESEAMAWLTRALTAA